MKSKLIVYIILLIFPLLTLSQASLEKTADTLQSPQLILNGSQATVLPSHFRSTDDLDKLSEENVNKQGLAELHAMGSAQFSMRQLRYILQKLKEPVIVIDLRQEAHGFINGLAVSWYAPHNGGNGGKTDWQVEQDEASHLSNLHIGDTITVEQVTHEDAAGEITNVQPYELLIKGVYSEKKVAGFYGVQYQRFYIADQRALTDKQVTRFVELAKSLPGNCWIYFHGEAGMGRTTTFMVLYDILRNGKSVALNDILRRQYLLDGADLAMLPPKTSYDYAYALQRLNLIKLFYQYVKTNKDNFSTSWSEWVKQNQ